MTISSTARKAGPFSGTGAQTAFPFSFKVFAASDVLVAMVDTTGAESTLALGNDYQVALNADQDGNPGGSVTLNANLKTGYQLTVSSAVPLTQGASIPNNGGFYPKVIEQALDKLTIGVQQIAGMLGRAVTFPLSDQSPRKALPVATARAGNFMAFDANGDPTIASGTGADSALRSDLASALAGSSLVSFIQAGVGAVLRSILDKLRERPLSVRDFGAVGDEVTDDTAAFLAALAAASSALYIPAGAYKVSASLAKNINKSYRIYGDGMGLSRVLQFADVDTFNLGNTGGGSGQITIEDLSIEPRTNMESGAAINVRNDTAIPSLRVKNVWIGSSSTYEFKYGIRAQNCIEANYERVMMYGLGTANFIGWEVTATMAATASKWSKCSVYNARYGVHIINSTAPGIEGSQFYGCDLTTVSTGVLFENTYGTGYFPPQLTWIGGHINATNRNFDLNLMSQATILGGLFYNSGPGPFMNINTCSDLHVSYNKFFNVGGGTPTGLDIYSGTGPINLGVVSNNYFNIGGGSMCMQLNAGEQIYNGQICNNVRAVGAKTLNVFNGTKDSSIRLFNNTPDPEDYYDTAALSGSTLSIAGLRSKFLEVSGTGTATTMPGGYPGDTVTLKSDDTTLTLAHDGINPDGFLLKGGLNFTFSTGSLITLCKANGGYWTEISRSV